MIPRSYSAHGAPYFPWSTFFKKICSSEVFVVLDNVPATNGRSYFNRCQVQSNNGRRFLTVPIERSRGLSRPRRDVRIAHDPSWKRKHQETLRWNYGRTPTWDTVVEPLVRILDRDWKFLLDMNVELIQRVVDVARCRTRIVLASTLDVDERDPSQRLIELGRILGMDCYVTGTGAFTYLAEDRFKAEGIVCRPIVPTATPPALGDGWRDQGLTVLDELSIRGPEVNWSAP